MEIWSELEERTVRLDMRTRDKAEIIAELVGTLIESGRVGPELPVVEEVLRREQVLSTGVGNGVALPHARLENYKGFALAFGRPQHPVEVGAVDGRPADLFFLLIGDRKDPSGMVRVLGRLARLCDSADFRKALRTAPTPRKAIDVLRLFETAPPAPVT